MLKDNQLVHKIFEKPDLFLDSTVFISAWVRNRRTSKGLGFLELNDGSCFKNIQVVFDDTLPNFLDIEKVTIGSSVVVSGVLVASQGGKQSHEIKANAIDIHGLASLDNPIQNKFHTFEYLRTMPHFRLRTNTFMATFRVRSLVAHAIHSFFQDQGFVYVHTPILTGTDAEGAGEMFRVTNFDYDRTPLNADKQTDPSQELLGKKMHLTVSGQLTVEPFCFGFRNVYTFGPTFRAENSNTARHANEFWMIEPEIAFADLNDNMQLAEDMLKYIIKTILQKAPEEMAFFNERIDKGLIERLENIINADFERITYTQAIDLLNASNQKFEFPTQWGQSLQSEHERYLVEQIFKKPLFVTDYPKDIKAFYMRQNEDGKTVRAMDLLVPDIGEIIGGSQREERLDELTNRMEEMNIDSAEYQWYLDTRRFGTFVHSGFGLGFERLVMYLTGMKNIRDVIPYPRTPNQAMF